MKSEYPNRKTGAFPSRLACSLGAGLLAILSSNAAVPPPEKLLPDDTLVMFTVPDYAKLRDIYQKSPQRQLWDDPAMKPFREKLVSKWKEEFVKPLEHDLDIRFDDYTSLPQGQITFAITQNGWGGKDEESPGVLLLMDSKDKSGQLKTNLADLHKKWVDGGKKIKTEKLRNIEFSVLPMSSNDVPKTLKKFMPQPMEVQELPAEGETKKPAPKNELIIGQADSLLIIGSSTKVVEKVIAALTGGSAPTLSEQASYAANHLALFRDSPIYGWVNVKSFMDIITRKSSAKGDSAPDAMGMFNPEKLLAATGFGAVKTLAVNYQNSNDGDLIQLFLSAPESSRQGILKILAGEPKEYTSPSVVPADVVRFQRWRLDGQKAWATLEKILTDISPQTPYSLNSLLDMATARAKEKDPDFDAKKNLIGNLGDDMISYEKAARGTDLKSSPSLFLLGVKNPDQFAAALKTIFSFVSPQGGPSAEREFLGRKIMTVPIPALPFSMGESTKSSGPRTLSYAASSGYIAMSTDASMLEEYLRSSESKAKALKETPGLTEAAQKVGGKGTGLFGYENQVETMRTQLEMLKKDSGSATNVGSLGLLPGMFGMATPEKNFKDWMDFSLLPNFDKVSKYFNFTVYAGSATVDGLSFKMFTPIPPGLKAAK